MQHLPFDPLPPTAAPVQAQALRRMAATPERVWALLAQPQHWPRWNPLVSRVKGGESPFEGFRWRSGGVTLHSRFEQAEAPLHLVWRGRGPGVRALHVWQLRACAGGVEVQTWEQFEGWLPRLAPGLMRRGLARALEAWLDALETAA